MRYYTQSGVHIVECVPSEFSIKVVNAAKKSCKYDTYANGGFFGNFKHSRGNFTLPITHLVADIESSNVGLTAALPNIGKVQGGKIFYDHGKYDYKPGNSFLGKTVSTLCIKGNNVAVKDLATLDDTYDYAIGGVPVIRGGNDVTFATYVKGQGWLGSELYATWHTLIGLKGDGKIYLMSWQSKTANMIYGMEAYKLFRPMGFVDLIKLDGGGSHHLRVNGSVKSTTSENRLINNIIVIEPQKAAAPTPAPSKTAWEKATAKGIFDGTRAKDALTREEAAIVLERLGLI